ncbi:initiation control protein YabA [Lactococcus insecticola]|uniref:Initiation-control protein YabA n=1 Tax=Pseudolactococcus insecticola TaxID=2709158 RepID=A0A6A0B627_9LACT|nr:initiation control protein YabA [Lactococcus insecticola]GFH40889.1 initiation-control protein YabA [Lactococcus insecticola]
MADKTPFFDNLSELEEQLVATLTQVSDIKSTYQKLISENTSLLIENARLRDRIAELSDLSEQAESTADNQDKAAKTAKKNPMSNLQEIYEDGFHVCRDFYGQRLEPGETCLYCAEILYR